MEHRTDFKLFDLKARAQFWSYCLTVADSLDSPHEANIDLL